MIDLLTSSRAGIAWKILAAFLLLILLLAVISARIASVQPVVAVPVEPQSEIEAVEAQVARAMPDFDAIDSVDERKEAFFTYISNYVDKQNRKVLETREALIPLREVTREGQSLSEQELAFVHELAEDYRLDPAEHDVAYLLEELLRRVDIIPTSLVLAQAANESAWGTSRFAREANNLFGQWCFSEGCGLVPERRASNANHEVRAFTSVEGSVQAYFSNINTHEAYRYLRELRSDMRAKGGEVNSMVLAHGLTRYSERGHAYVSELQSIIRANSLYTMDRRAVDQS